MDEHEGKAAQKAFWAGFEAAKMHVRDGNIRTAWNHYQETDEFSRLNPPGECVAVPREQWELDLIVQWLLFASEPVGQECCNRPGSECCGCPDTCYRTAGDIVTAMHARCNELRTLLAQQELQP